MNNLSSFNRGCTQSAFVETLKKLYIYSFKEIHDFVEIFLFCLFVILRILNEMKHPFHRRNIRLKFSFYLCPPHLASDILHIFENNLVNSHTILIFFLFWLLKIFYYPFSG